MKIDEKDLEKYELILELNEREVKINYEMEEYKKILNKLALLEKLIDNE